MLSVGGKKTDQREPLGDCINDSHRIEFNDFTAAEQCDVEIAVSVIRHPVEDVVGFDIAVS